MISSGAGAPQRAIDWLLRDRRTGRLVVAQRPNAPLVVFFLAALVRVALHPHGAVGTALTVVGTVAILWWSVDEVARGVNPFRRMLGGVVLLAVAGGFLVR